MLPRITVINEVDEIGKDATNFLLPQNPISKHLANKTADSRDLLLFTAISEHNNALKSCSANKGMAPIAGDIRRMKPRGFPLLPSDQNTRSQTPIRFPKSRDGTRVADRSGAPIYGYLASIAPKPSMQNNDKGTERGQHESPDDSRGRIPRSGKRA